MAITTIANMQIVPEKFTQYVEDRSTELNTFLNSGIATPDEKIGKLINGLPEGGSFIEVPMWNPLEGDDDTFSEDDLSIGNITTKSLRATLLVRGKAWGATDLSRVLGGADPMRAIINLLADWRNSKEQQIYLSVLKGILDPTSGCLKAHVNDISALSEGAARISAEATLDTKQLLGDHYDALGMSFMHSATYTYLQKTGMIARTPVFNPAGDTVEIQTYLGYAIKVDDGMPVTADGVYDTYFLGKGCFVQQKGVPEGLVETETDRDSIGSKNYLINRWAEIIHPRGMSWVGEIENYNNPKSPYPHNIDLANPANWKLAVDHKKCGIACLRHKLDK